MLIAKTIWTDTVMRLERKCELSKELILSETLRQERFHTKYISESNGRFSVSVLLKHRFSNGKSKPVYLKSFNSLKEAQDTRDEFLELYARMI